MKKKDLLSKTEEMLKLAATKLPNDVIETLENRKTHEEKKIAVEQLENILKNVEIAEKEERPICQDTGIPVFFVKLGTELDLNYDLNSVLKKAVKSATKNVPLRPNVVNPLNRENTGDNTGENQPIIHIEAFPGEKFELDLLLKGAGSENWSKLFMMKPTSSLKDVEKVIIDLIKEAGGEPCPPTIVGVGIGGSADTAGLLAKKSLLRPINEQNENEELAELENQITEKANETGIGPMGLGGKTTVLSTNILSSDCHTASLPVAVNLQCWADRRARAKLINDELEIEVP